ncbi:MAG: SdrD B-like domain-containing protein [Planctomycetaceae bacterium]
MLKRSARRTRFAPGSTPEELEQRILLTVQPVGASVVAQVRYQDLIDGPHTASNAQNASEQAEVIEGSSYVRSSGDATVLGSTNSFSELLAQDFRSSTAQSVRASTISEESTQWQLNGVAAGTTVTVDIRVTVQGFVEGNSNSLGGSGEGSVDLSVVLGQRLGADQTVLDAAAMVDNQLQFSSSGPLSWLPAGNNSDIRSRYVTNGAFTASFDVLAGEAFSLTNTLRTSAGAPGPFEFGGISDFSTNGMSYSLSTMAPGVSIDPVGPTGASGGDVTGKVWYDTNGDGLQTDGLPSPLTEVDWSGEVVYVDLDDDIVWDSGEPFARTDLDGTYRIAGLPAGTYNVRVNVEEELIGPASWDQTAPDDGSSRRSPHTVIVTDGVTVSDRDFGIRARPSSVGGTIWRDNNDNQVPDPLEPRMSGYDVFLDFDGDLFPDAEEPIVQTDSTGRYFFDGLPEAVYTIQWRAPSGQVPGSGSGSLYLPPDYASGFDFPITDHIGLITGNVFHDLSGDGLRDIGEGGQQEWTVFLDANNDGFLDPGELSTKTESNGNYTFDGLRPGDYNVAVVVTTDTAWWPTTQGTIDWALAKADLGTQYGHLPAVGNFTNDGQTDFLMRHWRSTVEFSVVVGNELLPSGSEPPVGFNPSQGPSRYEQIADMNGDGLDDLVLPIQAEGEDGWIAVWINDPLQPGTFTETFAVQLPNSDGHVYLPQIADLDGDGQLDMVVTTIPEFSTGSTKTLFRNIGGGNFAQSSISLLAGRSRLRHIEDLNADGLPDLVFDAFASQTNDGGAGILWNDPANPGSFSQRLDLSTDGFDFKAAKDLNLDGAIDLVLRDHDNVNASRNHRILHGDPLQPGQFTLAQSLSSTDPRYVSEITDLNNDGLPDLIIQDTGTSVALNRSEAAGTFGPIVSIVEGFIFTDVVDVNEDGFPDILSTDYDGSSGVSISSGVPGQFLPAQELDVYGMTAIDINRDGALDLVGTTYEAEFFAYLNSTASPGQFVQKLVDIEPLRVTQAIDLGGDGTEDMLLRNRSTHRHKTYRPTSSIRRSLTVLNNGLPNRFDVGVQRDRDHDGIGDAIEDAAPNGGDGNSDGLPDSEQPHVSSVVNAIGGGYSTIVGPADSRFARVKSERVGSAVPPSGVTFTEGVLSFELTDLAIGSTADVEIIRHGQASPPDAYYKFGPTATNPNPEWYNFTSSTTVSGANITLHLQDGGAGDIDLAADGTITDPGAVAFFGSLDVIAPEAAVPYQPVEVALIATPHGQYRYDIDWDGDGTTDETVDGSETMTVIHAFPQTSEYNVSVLATNLSTNSSNPATTNIDVSLSQIIAGDMYIGGTANNDKIVVVESRGGTFAKINSRRTGKADLSNDARVVVYGGDGDDAIRASNRLNRDVWFFGQQGNDRLSGGRRDDRLDGGDGHDWISAKRGNDLILGGDGQDRIASGRGSDIVTGGTGDDRIFGGPGRDLLIGGLGQDEVHGGRGSDILLGNAVAFESNEIALGSLHAEWLSRRPRKQRIDNLTSGSGTNNRENGDWFLNSQTLIDDNEIDHLFGSPFCDWLLE